MAKFAVVKFADDGDECYSEVPTTWLFENDTKCWWPHSKNPSSYMMNNTVPGKNWKSYAVDVVTYCDTLMAARRRANNIEYTSCEENGKGKRRKTKTLKVTQSCEDSDNSEEGVTVTPPPMLTTLIPVNPEPIINYVDNTEHAEMIFEERLNQQFLLENLKGSASTSSASTVTLVNSKASTPAKTTSGGSASWLRSLDTSSSAISFSEDLGKLQVTCGQILQYVKSINEKLKSQGSQGRTFTDYQLLKNFIPIETEDGLNSFDSALSDDGQNLKQLFMQFVGSIGGNSTKDNIYRVLKRVYSYKFGVSCSWLGLRGNLKMCNRLSINIIKEVIMNTSSETKEVEFDHIASEWFRLCNLNLKRQNKTK